MVTACTWPSEKYLPLLTHTTLAPQVTKEKAATYSIGHVVKLVAQKYSKEESEYLQQLYSRVKGEWLGSHWKHCRCAQYHTHTSTDEYNQYIELNGGAIYATSQQGNKVYTIDDDIPLLNLLSCKTHLLWCYTYPYIHCNTNGVKVITTACSIGIL